MCQKGPWVGKVTMGGEEGAPQPQPTHSAPVQGLLTGHLQDGRPCAPNSSTRSLRSRGAAAELKAQAWRAGAGWTPALGIFQG